jgi:uncharacterized protein with ParB-like and HNH nuclease domain
MKADPFKVGEVLKNPRRFVVPIYQRTYAWKITPHLETFLTQVEAKAEELLRGTQRFPHYMGALLLIPRGAYAFGRLEVVDVVDGQQRLTTFQIYIAALRDLALSIGETETSELLSLLLLNSEVRQFHVASDRYKLYPTAYDRKLYFDVIDSRESTLRTLYPDAFYANGKVRDTAELILRAWSYFRKEAETFVRAADNEMVAERLGALSGALLEGFQVIVITLEEHDDAQVIFETLNAGGEPLSAMDLVRNDVFHRAAQQGENVEVLMERRWSSFENPFWKKLGVRGRIKKPRIDFFLSDTLAAETGKEILLTELYARYRNFIIERSFNSVDEELETLLRHAPTFRELVEPSGFSDLSRFSNELSEFDVTTAYPLAFVISESKASDSEKNAIYRLIISFVVRRLICGLTAKNYNNIFLRIVSGLRELGVSLANVETTFLSLDGPSARFPTDSEFREAIVNRRQYGMMQQKRLRHILAELERAARDKFDESMQLRDDLTIEHVLPESWLEHWPLPDGTLVPADFRTGMSELQLNIIAEREALKNTLGNLTLLTSAGNPSLGNQSFGVKRKVFGTALLKLSHEIAKEPEWDATQIRARAAGLAQLAISIWPSPSLSPY